MKPALAHHLVQTFLPKNGRLLDPFGGVGTIAFEAAMAGAHSWSFDISPAAHSIALAKLGRVDPHNCNQLLQDLQIYIDCHEVTDDELTTARDIRFNGLLCDYFSPRTFREILIARRFFKRRLPLKTADEALVFSSLLHILHGNRPYALSRRSHPITPFAPTGPSCYRALMPRLHEKLNRSLAAAMPAQFKAGRAMFQDATVWWPDEVCDLDAIITSPPFFDSTRFYLANWMRLWFCGWEAKDFRIRPKAFVDERQKCSFQAYEPIFRQARERLKKNGILLLHLGKSAKCDMAAEISKLAAKWFCIVDVFNEAVTHCESHGIRDKGTVTSHQFLVLA